VEAQQRMLEAQASRHRTSRTTVAQDIAHSMTESE
jgi:hypothetical protein